MNKYDLNERERLEIELCQHYAEFYHHGTPGHQRMLVIAKLANILNQRENDIKEQLKEEALSVLDTALHDLDEYYKENYEEKMSYSDRQTSVAADLAFEEAMRVVRETRKAIKDEQ